MGRRDFTACEAAGAVGLPARSCALRALAQHGAKIELERERHCHPHAAQRRDGA